MKRSITAKRGLAQSPGAFIDVLQRVVEGVDNAWWWAEGLLRSVGLLPRLQSSHDPLEDVVQETLRPVEPSDDFRRSLRSELAFAAHQRGSGLVVERPRPFREGLILGIAFGFLGILATTLFVALRPRRHAGASQP